MAELSGVTIKGLKNFKDIDGCPVYQGNVYIRNKKVGFWSQDRWGGDDVFDFDVTELDEIKNKFYTKNPKVDEFKIYGKQNIDWTKLPKQKPEKVSLDIFMYDLLVLLLDEKLYKKNVKRGYNCLLKIDYYETDGPTPVAKSWSTATKEEAEKLFDTEKKKYPQAYATIYTDINDFVVK